MKIRHRVESDEWTLEGRNITESDSFETIRKTIEKAPIIVEHWFYRASTSPDRFVFEDFDDFMNYLNSKAAAGDDIYVWNFSEVCKYENTIAQGKCPADDGCTPRKGAY